MPLVPVGEQTVSGTRSRRSGPRAWSRSVVWLVGAGVHPRASAVTVRVAEDLAGRMDYTTGQVRYCLDGMVVRLGLSRATVCRHVAVLREMGSLAWAERGSRTNAHRTQGRTDGYARTATVYAAVIPPVFDQAMGHTVIGTGYTARIIIDHRNHIPAPRTTPAPAPAGVSASPASDPGPATDDVPVTDANSSPAADIISAADTNSSSAAAPVPGTGPATVPSRPATHLTTRLTRARSRSAEAPTATVPGQATSTPTGPVGSRVRGQNGVEHQGGVGAGSVDNSPVDNRGSRSLETPSLSWLREVGQAEVVGGEGTSTAHTRTAPPVIHTQGDNPDTGGAKRGTGNGPRAPRGSCGHPARPRSRVARTVRTGKPRAKRTLTILGHKITPARIDRARQMAATLRPLVNWIQGARLNELSWVMLDMAALDWSDAQAQLWLQRLGDHIGTGNRRRRRPDHPHRVIAAALLRHDREQKHRLEQHGPDPQQAKREATVPNAEFEAVRAALAARENQNTGLDLVEYTTVDTAPEDMWDRAAVRADAETDPALVLAYARHAGHDAAVALYGTTAERILHAALEDHRAGIPGQAGFH